jgi:RNAse (barnase) inhibitor barstar
MDATGTLLADAAKAGVYQLNVDARQLAQAAADAGLAAFRIDIGHAHDKDDFLEHVSKALKFPASFGGNWDALADSLRDLSWLQGKGYVVILEKSKHFCDAHKHEFDEAIDVLKEAADYWKKQGKPFWGLIGGPDGWKSGYPPMPS